MYYQKNKIQWIKELNNLLTKLLKVDDRLLGSCTLLLMS
jgi:hypothetical protein